MRPRKTSLLSFEEYLALIDNRNPRAPSNQWLYEPGLRIYVRVSHPVFRPPEVDFDLANMDADEPGQGALTRFLDRYEPRFGFYVQNCLNERLVLYLQRRGYKSFSLAGDYGIHLFRGRPAGRVSASLI